MLSGSVAGKKEIIEKIYFKGQMLLGSAMDPYRASLLMNNLRTYPLRYHRQLESAKKIVDFLVAYDHGKPENQEKLKTSTILG